MSPKRTRRHKDMIFQAPPHVIIKRNVTPRILEGIQQQHRNDRKNRMDRRKYRTRTNNAPEMHTRNLENYNALVSAGWDASRIYTNKEHRPRELRLYEKDVIYEHERVSPLKLGKRLGTQFG